MLTVFRVLLLLALSGRLQTTASQYVPPIECPNYFQYLEYDGSYIGRITLPNVSGGETKLDVKFSQRSPVHSNYYGSLSLFHDKDTTIRNIENGRPISYRVDFPLSNVLPKLTQIAVDDEVVCQASEYTPPRTTLNLQHVLRAQVGTNFVPHSVYSNRLPQGTQTQGAPVPIPIPIPIPTRKSPNPVAPRLSTDLPSVCGQQQTTEGLQPFILGGTVLKRGEHPWLTAIYQKHSSGLTFLCGGSLVSTRTIVTAAHCFELTRLTADRIVVYLGRHNLTNYMENNVVSRDIQSLLIHPDYNATAFPDADVALLQMVAPVSFTDYVRPICIWSESSDASIIVGTPGVVAGWGGDENQNVVSPLPKMVEANIISDGDCTRSSPLFQRLTSPRTICAGQLDGTGPCMGDSGGGLMIFRNGRWRLRGVVSAGHSTQFRCNLFAYVIYCDLAKHLSWVQSNVLT